MCDVKNFIVCAVFCMFQSASFAQDRSMSYEFVASNFGSIETVQKCGPWQEEGKSGEFRVFTTSFYDVTRRFYQSMLFVDLLRRDETSGQVVVERGISVHQMNSTIADYPLSFVKLRCEQGKINNIRIHGTLQFMPNYGKTIQHKFCVLVDGVSGATEYYDARSAANYARSCRGNAAKISAVRDTPPTASQ